MKKIIHTVIILLISTTVLIRLDTSSFTQVKETNDPTTWKYYRIDVNTNDDPIFKTLLKETIGMKLDRYTVVVDCTNNDTTEHYLIIGQALSVMSFRYSYYFLSDSLREKITKWNQKNKIELIEGTDYRDDFEKYSDYVMFEFPIEDKEDATTWHHFKLTVDDNNNKVYLFTYIQKHLRIDPLFMKYDIIVNFTNEVGHYIILIDKKSKNSITSLLWELPTKVVEELINYKGKNKVRLDPEDVDDWELKLVNFYR